MKRFLSAAFVAAAASLLIAGPAAAHTQTVTPPGQDAVVEGPIARPWVQGHCHAQAPAVSGEASGGVVVFAPQGYVPCPDTVTNPGSSATPPLPLRPSQASTRPRPEARSLRHLLARCRTLGGRSPPDEPGTYQNRGS